MRQGCFCVLGGGWLHFQVLRYDIQGKLLMEEQFRCARAWRRVHTDPEAKKYYMQCLENTHPQPRIIKNTPASSETLYMHNPPPVPHFSSKEKTLLLTFFDKIPVPKPL